jgi:hypothetical protein
MTQLSTEEITPDSLGRKVLSESLQHPSTLLPAAASILSGLYMAVITPSPGAFAVTLASGTVALISTLFHYFVRGETIMRRELARHTRVRKESERKGAEELIETCRSIGFEQGAQAIKELLAAYDRLIQFLSETFSPERRSSAERFRVLGDEVLRQGLVLVHRSLDLYVAIRKLDYDKLQAEMVQWQRELDSGMAPDSEVQEFLRGRLVSHRKRLELHTNHQKNLLANLSQCEILEASLDAGYLELVDIAAGGEASGGVRSAQSLEKLVETTRKVEEKLRRGSLQQANDDMYDISKIRENE